VTHTHNGRTAKEALHCIEENGASLRDEVRAWHIVFSYCINRVDMLGNLYIVEPPNQINVFPMPDNAETFDFKGSSKRLYFSSGPPPNSPRNEVE
jgi:hypothetical protein